jgi:hypothetical protein
MLSHSGLTGILITLSAKIITSKHINEGSLRKNILEEALFLVGFFIFMSYLGSYDNLQTSPENIIA